MKLLSGKVMAVCSSDKKGTAKKEIDEGVFIENYGLKGDAHAGEHHRQISLLSYEKVEDFRKSGAKVDTGAFGENLLVAGLDLAKLPLGTLLRSNDVLMEVTQIGKECHSHCNIYYQVGECIMPREGIFARVLHGGKICKGDLLYVETPV